MEIIIGDPARHIVMLNTVRQTFSSPTLTIPKAEDSAPSAASSSAALSPAPIPDESLTKSVPPEQENVSVEGLAQRIQEWKDAAVYLRKNVVQGVQDEESGAWSECPLSLSLCVYIYMTLPSYLSPSLSPLLILSFALSPFSSLLLPLSPFLFFLFLSLSSSPPFVGYLTTTSFTYWHQLFSLRASRHIRYRIRRQHIN